MAVLKFLGTAVLAVVYLPFYLVWQVLRLIGLILWWLPELFMPRLRQRRAIARFKRRADAVRRKGEARRRTLSQKNGRRNANELAGDVIARLQGRRRDIAPNVFESTHATIRACGEAADVDTLEAYFTLLTMTEPAHLNARLMAGPAAA